MSGWLQVCQVISIWMQPLLLRVRGEGLKEIMNYIATLSKSNAPPPEELHSHFASPGEVNLLAIRCIPPICTILTLTWPVSPDHSQLKGFDIPAQIHSTPKEIGHFIFWQVEDLHTHLTKCWPKLVKLSRGAMLVTIAQKTKLQLSRLCTQNLGC